MKTAVAISVLLFFAVSSFASRTEPLKIEGKDQDKYIFNPIEVDPLRDYKGSMDTREEWLTAEIIISVMTRRFVEEIPEFQDREEIERGNDEN